MNIQSVKQLVWLAAIGLSGWLGWEVYDFSQNKAELEKYVDPAWVRKASYEDVQKSTKTGTNPTVRVASLNNGFGNLNWTGKQEVVIKAPTTDTTKPKPKLKVMVKDLLTITFIASTSAQDKAIAYVDYLKPGLAQAMKAPSDHVLRVGKRLKGNFTHIEVEAITVEGVLFKFNDEERESELVKFDPEGEGGIRIATLTEGALPPVNNALGNVSQEVSQSYRRPERTVETRRNHFQIGTQSLAEVNRDYTRILSNDVRYRRARTRSNKVKGIQVTDVRPGSIPAEAGLVAGEILISVNGHQVVSESDLINFIKRESANTDVWEAVFELNGKQFTRTYTSPES